MPNLKVTGIKLIGVAEQYTISFTHYKEPWTVTVNLKDGIVYGDCNTNVSTSALAYFDLPVETRQRHFEQFKKVIYEARGKKPSPIENRKRRIR